MKSEMPELYNKTTIDEIRDSMLTFIQMHFDSTLNELSENLLTLVQKNRRLNFFRGGVQSWAAAIIYTIARFNFLFDKSIACHVAPEMICKHFSESKTKLIKKVDQIEPACNFELGDPAISLKSTVGMFEVFSTSSGFIIPKFSIESSIENIEKIDASEAKWVKKRFDKKIKAEKAKITEKLKRAALKKSSPVKNQLELFI
jgi:hypothetical protein